MIHLEFEDLLHIANRTLDGEVAIRDAGMLQAALARPQATIFGKDAYPAVVEKAAALLHSLARNHGLIDGNKRLALSATFTFLGINGRMLTLTNDEAYDLVMAVAAGELDDIDVIAARLTTTAL
ncbi:MAG: type II toxin-antitoxin system death-on-curing family toxin [Actinophytocola sp.]|nr:type II toxin-antitoxin system death-on-curing family toxin [Actinophytocola sp.]